VLAHLGYMGIEAHHNNDGGCPVPPQAGMSAEEALATACHLANVDERQVVIIDPTTSGAPSGACLTDTLAGARKQSQRPRNLPSDGRLLHCLAAELQVS
jgi:hypothetical protein